MDAAKFEVGQEDLTGGSLASVDEDLGELPGGYGESRIVLMPRDPQWSYAYWDVPNEHKEELRRQGGQQLALRLYDVTDINLEYQAPHNVQEYLCDELAREWYLPIPVSDRDYAVDIGYRCADGRWLVLARSAPVRVPPVYPSDWIEDHFITVNFDEDLRGKIVYKLGSPTKGMAAIHDEIFSLSQSAEEQRVTGSLFGSMQQVPISSYVFPSGIGMSGVGFSASMPPLRPRKFWLVADAELIVYGATEPDATVIIGDRPIQLNPDGTFRFQMSFQDGPLIDYPITAVAADGEQTRSIHMNFTRKTSERNTNTKEEAVEELLLPEEPDVWLKKFRADVPESFYEQALQKAQDLERSLEASGKKSSFVQVVTHPNSEFPELKFDLPPDMEEEFREAANWVNKLLKRREIQAGLYLRLKDIDLENTSEVIGAITPILFPVIAKGNPNPLSEPPKIIKRAKDVITLLSKTITIRGKQFIKLFSAESERMTDRTPKSELTAGNRSPIKPGKKSDNNKIEMRDGHDGG